VLESTIPSEIGRLTHLVITLALDDNDLTGTIPTELARCQNLEIITLYNNKLTGDVGPVITSALPQSLIALNLDENLLTGTIPPSIGMFTDLYFLNVHGSNLSGTIPNELGLLSMLTFLSLSSNSFNGTVPTSLASLPLLGKSTQSLLFLYPVCNFFSHSMSILWITESLYLNDNDLTGSLDAFCGIVFEHFVANTCGQDEIECTCCTHCGSVNGLYPI
jgi:hypothetical protein